MEKKLYDISVSDSDGHNNNSLCFFECDDEALKAANTFLRNSRKATSVKVRRIDEVPNTHLASYVTIHENSAAQKLALSKKQKTAVKAIYKAIEKAQNIGVHFVESTNYGIYAFNGQDVDEWDIDAHSEDANVVSFEDLTYVGPPMYEQSAFNDELYIKFKE